MNGAGMLGLCLLALRRFHFTLASQAGLCVLRPASLRHFLLFPDCNSCPQFRSGTLT